MADSPTEIKPLPTRIDRYPAKMIAHLASSLVGRYTNDATHLLDPFCGSGAVLRAASLDGIPVTGIDVNPFGVLLSSVKLEGFDMMRAMCLTETLLDATNDNRELPVEWDSKEYWFTIATLRKFERLRYRAFEMDLGSSNAGRAVLLAFALSVRQCSRADQRSPKPFISKNARNSRKGQHFDPVVTISRLLNELGELYGRRRRNIEVQVLHKDISDSATKQFVRRCSHVITSPPYINAQDYFRNSKLELYLLEGVLPFRVNDIIHRFIGTERGVDRNILTGAKAEQRRRLIPELNYLEKHREEQAVVVHRYLDDMQRAFNTIRSLIEPGGTLVVVCGDNLIGGRRICTWRVLNRCSNRWDLPCSSSSEIGFVIEQSHRGVAATRE